MQPPTLEIHVTETITVKDVVFEVIKAVVRFVEHFIEAVEQVIKQEPVSNVDNRAPPTLEVRASDGIGVIDSFGKR